jgi:hypothetical protein
MFTDNDNSPHSQLQSNPKAETDHSTCDTAEAWTLVFEGYDSEDEGHREALCAMGNGYFVTREAVSEGMSASGKQQQRETLRAV